jgi:hypothetical protein
VPTSRFEPCINDIMLEKGYHISLKPIFARFCFCTDILVEETAEELEPTARAVVELDLYLPGLSSLLSRGISWICGGRLDLSPH